MNKEARKAILEARLVARMAEREQRLAAIHARINAHRAEREQKIIAIHDRIEARKAEMRHLKEAGHSVEAASVQVSRNPELQAMKAAMMADVPTIHFPEDDPKYNSARKYGYV